jgi:RNA polymerase sigma-70 factor (ECF subfamily)
MFVAIQKDHRTASHSLINGILPTLLGICFFGEQQIFMMDEHALRNGLRDLDPQAITQIHEAYFPLMYRYARYRIGDDNVAEDIVSEAFVRLLEAVHVGKGPRTSLRGWLMGTVSNLVNDYFRNVYRQPTDLLPDDIPAENGNPVARIEQKNRRNQICQALTNLTLDQQHVLSLRFGSGCSLAETAEIMDKKPNAVKQLQFRALTALRQHIEEQI